MTANNSSAVYIKSDPEKQRLSELESLKNDLRAISSHLETLETSDKTYLPYQRRKNGRRTEDIRATRS